jgi:hypothetical protein
MSPLNDDHLVCPTELQHTRWFGGRAEILTAMNRNGGLVGQSAIVEKK